MGCSVGDPGIQVESTHKPRCPGGVHMYFEGICKETRCMGGGTCKGIEHPAWGFQSGFQQS